MRRFISFFLLCVSVIIVAGCDVPTPPPEIPTPTPGSTNPENPLAALALTPAKPALAHPFQALNAGPGHIYFVRDSHVWKVNPDGTGETQISDLPANCPPQPSHDGSEVAFVSGSDLYVVPSSGGQPMKIASGILPEGQRLGWSKDDSLVGYVSLDPSTPGTIQGWAVPAGGGKATLIATLNQATSGLGAMYQPEVQWSPDGFWVMVGGFNNPTRLLRWPTATGDSSDDREITGGEADWSPDSHSVAYAETLEGALEMYQLVSSEATPLRNNINLIGTRLGEYGQGPGPRWSPASNGSDSDVLAYRSASIQGEPQVGLKERWDGELQAVPAPSNNPSWSPSGDQLVVETGFLRQDTLGRRWVADGLGIVKLNLKGAQTVKPLIKNAQWPVWGQ